MKRRVVITGMGALSALGATTDDLWNGLLANRSGVRRVQRLVESGITVTTGGEVDAVSPQNVDRDHEIADRAIEDALAAVAARCGRMRVHLVHRSRHFPDGAEWACTPIRRALLFESLVEV